MKRIISALCTLYIVLLLVACGGGSSVSGGSGGPINISGVVAKGFFTSGIVRAYSLVGGVPTLLKEGFIAGGAYNLSYSGYTGPVLLIASGKYLDEITGRTLPEIGDLTLQAAIPTANGNMTANITALTELAVRKANDRVGGLTTTNIAYCNDLIENIFKIDNILTVTPVNYSLSALQGASTVEAREYTLVLAAISQMAVGSSADSVITRLQNSLVGDIMSPTMATELGATINLINGTNLLLNDLANIGEKIIGITFKLTANTPNIAGFQFTLLVPSTHYIPTLSNSTEVPAGNIIGIGQIGRDAIYAGFIETTHELNVGWGNLTSPIASGDVMTIYFKLPAGVSHPPPVSEGYFYKDLIVSDRFLNDPVSGATLTARDAATGEPLNLTVSIN